MSLSDTGTAPTATAVLPQRSFLQPQAEGATNTTDRPDTRPACLDATMIASDSEATNIKEIEGEDTLEKSSSVKAAPFKERKRDFWFLPIPKRVRYHPDRPFVFSLAMNYLFAFVCRIVHCDHYGNTLLTTFCRLQLLLWLICRWSPIAFANWRVLLTIAYL